jgi:hypothetical protein
MFTRNALHKTLRKTAYKLRFDKDANISTNRSLTNSTLISTQKTRIINKLNGGMFLGTSLLHKQKTQKQSAKYKKKLN